MQTNFQNNKLEIFRKSFMQYEMAASAYRQWFNLILITNDFVSHAVFYHILFIKKVIEVKT